MEDHQVTYALAIDIPLNRETTRMYSPNDELMWETVESAMKHIKNVIKREGFITLERVFRTLELRANPECPHILLTTLDDWRFDGELLSIFFGHDFELLSVNVKKPELRAVKREEFSDEETNDPENAETDHEDERRQSSESKGSEQG